MNSGLLLTPNPNEGESFSSFIMRVAKANFISLTEFTKITKSSYSKKYLHNSYQHIDSKPYEMFNMHELARCLRVEKHMLSALSAEIVLEKLGADIDDYSNYDLIRGCIDTNRKYCPNCLGEIGYYKLLWQVSEIDVCEIHNCSLISRCFICGKLLPIVSRPANYLFCSCCQADLRRANSVEPKYVSRMRDRKFSDWSYLLSDNDARLDNNQGISINQNIASKLLHLLNDNNGMIHGSNIESIIGAANGREADAKYIGLPLVLAIIRACNISCEDFFKLVGNDTKISCNGSWIFNNII